jgi:hypothetical protein
MVGSTPVFANRLSEFGPLVTAIARRRQAEAALRRRRIQSELNWCRIVPTSQPLHHRLLIDQLERDLRPRVGVMDMVNAAPTTPGGSKVEKPSHARPPYCAKGRRRNRRLGASPPRVRE